MEPLVHSPPIIRKFTREAVRAVDREAIEEYAIPGIVLMENAASAIAEACGRMLARQDDASAIIFCGTGNNGGDGLALARKLDNAGVHCECVLAGDRESVGGDAKTNLLIAERMGVPIRETPSFERPTIVVDALFGTGLARPIEGAAAVAIESIGQFRDHGARVLAVDVPSGLDCDSGEPIGESVVRADVTVTLAGLKAGFDRPASRAYTGEILVGDIGVPIALLNRHGRA